MIMQQLFGPFKQVIPLSNLPMKGALTDDALEILTDGAIVCEEGRIVEIGPFREYNPDHYQFEEILGDHVLMPAMVDCHTHLVWGGTRAHDYALRMAGKSYQEILAAGGGIFDSVRKTQEASPDELAAHLVQRATRHLKEGVTTIEVKSGYGLIKEHELKILQSIRSAQSQLEADLIPTCLGAHVCPKEFESKDFLTYLEKEVLPQVLVKGLARRVDIFIEDHAFPPELAKTYLLKAKKLGFDLTVHADQFTTGGAKVAVEVGARSADHLEASGDEDIRMLAASEVMPVALPGASLGLGVPFAPARKLLDAGAGLAIATDWNPGSGPMGDLLVQASLLGIYQKLSSAELFAGITFRAATALGLADRGRLAAGYLADMMAFETDDYRELFYHQGKLKPAMVWKKGKRI